jgi:8-oxo-dGTP pyrophosphatase MutT (NUDIX family)
MPDPQAVAALTVQFRDMSDGQTMKSLELIRMLFECSPDPFSREQFTPGHITCSGLVLAPDARRILIVHHRRLGRWLLPGGHVEPFDETIDAAAAREVLEETGISVADGWLAGADVHGIPAKGREPYHLHHDLLFWFRAETEAFTCSEESHSVAWCTRAELDRYAIPDNVRRAWERFN